MHHRVPHRPRQRLALGVELPRDRRQRAVGQAAAPVLRRRQDLGVLPIGARQYGSSAAIRLVGRQQAILHLAQSRHAHLGHARQRRGLPALSFFGAAAKRAKVFIVRVDVVVLKRVGVVGVRVVGQHHALRAT